MLTRSFEKAFELVDYTEELLLVPNTWGLINDLGIFGTEAVSQHAITVESHEGTLGIVTDQPRGARNLVNKDETRILRSFALSHHPLDDQITPQDVQGKRAYGSPDAAETEAAVMARKLARVRRAHAITLETARAYTITTGQQWAPNGTVSANFYTDFGITRKNVDFVFGTSTTDMVAKVEEVIAHIQDNVLTGDVVNEVIVLCSPGFFSKLIGHATVKEAYKYYSSTQEPLRNRLGTGLYRRFVFGGATFVEYRGSYNGSALITANEAFALPTGVSDMFVTYFGPANRLDMVNTLGEEAYLFSYRDPRGQAVEIQSESNFLNLLRRPAGVVRLFSSN